MRHRNHPLVTWRSLTAATIALALLLGILVGDSAQAKVNEPHPATSSVKRYTRDLTAAAEDGQFDSFDDQLQETKRVLAILAGNERNSPILLTDSQAERNVVIAGVARQIARGRAPELMGRRVLRLDLDALFRGAKDAEQLKAALENILSEIESSDAKVVLFIDPIHALIGTSAAFDATVSNVLRDAIANGKLQCIGTTTQGIFEETIATDKKLASLFTTVGVAESVAEEAAKDNNDSDTDSAEGEEFTGEKISDELRTMIEAPGAPARVKVILQVDDLNNPELRATLAKWKVKISHEIPRFKTVAIEVPTAAVSEIASSDSTNYVSIDRPLQGLGHIETTIGETTMLAQTGNGGFDGSGIGVAVLDSGISSSHQSLSGKIVYSRDFTGEGDTHDDYGHGTFVASMIVRGSGTYGGVAGGAKLLDFRVLNSRGTGSTSALLNALNAVLQYRTTYNIRIVNLSLGSVAVDSYKNDAVCRAVRKVVNAGIVVVAAAGNDGKSNNQPKLYGRIHSPGNEPSAITVGASNTFGTNRRSDDVVTTYSSRGPTRSFWTEWNGRKHYDNLMKPDLVAPGNKIISSAAAYNRLVSDNPALCVSQCSSNEGNMRLSGTSVSTPIVAGAAAILLEANPKLTPNLVKMILMYTAQSLKGYNMLEQGAGQVNLEGAVRLAKLVRTDLSSTTAVGTSLLTSSAPTARTTIASETFTWAQGVIFNHNWASGSALITKYQSVYGQGVLLSDGVLLTDGVLLSDNTKLSSGVLLSDNIMISKGVLLSDGILLMTNRVLLSDGVLLTDGVLIGDGVLVGDGVLSADGVLITDGVIVADGVITADVTSYFSGDNTTCMAEEF